MEIDAKNTMSKKKKKVKVTHGPNNKDGCDPGDARTGKGFIECNLECTQPKAGTKDSFDENGAPAV
jgi:hypothetical protein